ncbi:MAG: argininosuccinate lyase [Solirubrobacterales bacterium]|nr:argininosuccinate lyase [Solirubrobacterales bacterium]
MNRFSEPPDPDFDAINRSLDVDVRLWPFDIAQSRAHVAMLAAQGIIGSEDAGTIADALAAVEGELEAGLFAFEPTDEDIHMAIERRVSEIAGEAGGRIHTARSRNDQVATDLVLFTREAAADSIAAIERLIATLITAAEAHLDWPLPGYTHLQRAQPVYLSHHLLAYVWMLERDRQRFQFVASQCGLLPLGSGALAGVNFDTDRGRVATELGFTGVTANSVDAVSNRDFIVDYLSAAALCATHLSRLGAELVLWSSQEFGFVELPDRWTSGSSLMPQKKNPDAAELLRAKAPRVTGDLSSFLGVLHALPLAYNKDMQEDKEYLFDAVDTLALALAAATGMIEGAQFNRERMGEAASDGMIAATDLADLLVRRDVPFRQSHATVGQIVRETLAADRELSSLSLTELQAYSPELDDEAIALLAQDGWLESKTSEGGTALARVQEQLAAAHRLLA